MPLKQSEKIREEDIALQNKIQRHVTKQSEPYYIHISLRAKSWPNKMWRKKEGMEWKPIVYILFHLFMKVIWQGTCMFFWEQNPKPTKMWRKEGMKWKPMYIYISLFHEGICKDEWVNEWIYHSFSTYILVPWSPIRVTLISSRRFKSWASSWTMTTSIWFLVSSSSRLHLLSSTTCFNT